MLSAVAFSLLLPAFTAYENRSLHPDEGDFLTFSYSNVDMGDMYFQDRDTAFFPFKNNTGHNITISSIRSKTTLPAAPFDLVGEQRRMITAGESGVIKFVLDKYADRLEGHYDHPWVISFEGTEKKQYLNIFCDLHSNKGNLEVKAVHLPTVNEGDTILFSATVKNTGKSPVDIYPKNWGGSWDALITDNVYPVTIDKGDSVQLNFELRTEGLMRSYEVSEYFDCNDDDEDWLIVTCYGDLVSDSYPSIKFDSTELHFYGVQGDAVYYEFWFVNDGNEPLIISMCKGSCGCVVPEWPKDIIRPGERNVIKVKYDGSRIGPINKSITVTTNASLQPVVLKIKGNITPGP